MRFTTRIPPPLNRSPTCNACKFDIPFLSGCCKGLEGEILAVSDREQQRLGQELHDGICQHLTAVAFMARSVALRLKNHRVIEVSDIEKIAQLVNQAASDMRDLSRALHQSDV